MQIVSIIRNRGQLTIPDAVRKIVNWITPSSAVTITVVNSDEIRIKPHQKQIDWDKLWKMIELSRSFKGKRGNLSEFIVEDRNRH